MADFLSEYSIQQWLESCPQGYLANTEYGHAPGAREPEVVLANDVLRTESTGLGHARGPLADGGSAGEKGDEKPTTDQPDVRMRLRRAARQILSQHQRLESFYAMVAGAMADGDEREALVRLARFRDALDAHFSLEEGVCFPALARLRPGLSAQIAALFVVLA